MKRAKRFRTLLIILLFPALLAPQPVHAESWWQWLTQREWFTQKNVALVTAGALGIAGLTWWMVKSNKKKDPQPGTLIQFLENLKKDTTLTAAQALQQYKEKFADYMIKNTNEFYKNFGHVYYDKVANLFSPHYRERRFAIEEAVRYFITTLHLPPEETQNIMIGLIETSSLNSAQKGTSRVHSRSYLSTLTLATENVKIPGTGIILSAMQRITATPSMVTIYQSRETLKRNSNWSYTYNGKVPDEIPLITKVDKKQITITIGSHESLIDIPTLGGIIISSQDLLGQNILFQQWTWGRDTHFSSGIHYTEIIAWEKHLNTVTVIILTKGIENLLQTDATKPHGSLYEHFKDTTGRFKNLKTVYVVPTDEAIPLYNALASQGKSVLMVADLTIP